MRAKISTLLLAIVFSTAMAASADAMDSIGTLGQLSPGDHGRPNDHDNPGDYDRPDDHSKTGDYGRPDDHGRPGDHGELRDHSRGTIVVTAVGPKGRPASGASIFMDGMFMGSTNPQGKLTIPNVRSGDHRISAAKTSWRESLHGSAQVRVVGKQTVQASIKLNGRWR